jgi:hypothetical protein
MDTLGGVQTLHLVDATIKDGQWKKGVELWYDRDVGVAATEWQGDQIRVHRLDNGKDAWIITAGSKFGQRSPSLGALRVVADLLQTGLFTRDFVRVPREDKTVEGMPWRAYSLSNGTGTVRLLVWLDDTQRVCAWEKRRLLRDGVWETYRTGTIEYDVTPDPALFQPGFAPDIEVVEPGPDR